MIDPLYYIAALIIGLLIGAYWPRRAPKHPIVAPSPITKSPAPDAMTTEAKNSYCEQMGHPNCYELRGKIAGVYKEGYSGNLCILLEPDKDQFERHDPVPSSWGNVLGELLIYVRAAPGYEDKIIVPKPGTHVQVLQDARYRELTYFIGIIN